MGLDNLQPAEGSRKTRIRRGRGTGSGIGKTSGRGGKGQTARAGKGRPRGFEGGQMPLYRRLPKFGFNSPFRRHYQVVNLSALEKHFNAGDTVNGESLAKAGLVKDPTGLVKILGDGAVSKKFIVKAHKFSKSATQKINQAGGQVEEIKLPGEATEESSVGSG
ncbi:50S ribosomal protein L15 [bacterium]|nr:50S ribosomal protein L15 [bacterium]